MVLLSSNVVETLRVLCDVPWIFKVETLKVKIMKSQEIKRHNASLNTTCWEGRIFCFFFWSWHLSFIQFNKLKASTYHLLVVIKMLQFPKITFNSSNAKEST